MNTKKLLLKSAILLPLSLLFACGSGEKKSENDSSLSDTTSEESLTEDSKSFNYILPSPLQIASIFHRAKLKFDDKLLNKAESVNKYNTEIKLTLNMGVYATDLAYCLLNSQNQLSLSYLKTTRDLADKIGMGSVYNTEALVERFQKNIDNVDTLSDIISTIQTESEAFLEENERRFTALCIFTGAWIEAIYMASKTIETKFNDKIATEISEQHVSLRNLIKLLEEHSESKQPEFNEVLTKLKEINTMFENTAGYKAQPLEEGEEMPLSFQLTPQETNAIGAKVTVLRNLVVN